MAKRSSRGLATWLTTSTSPLFVLDSRGVVLVFNKGCEQLTQWSADDIIGKTCHAQSTADPGLPSSLTGVLYPPNDGLSPSVSRVVLHRPDGSLLEQEIHFFPLGSEDPEESPHLLGLFTDPRPTPETLPSRRLDVARHTAELYQRYRLDRLVVQSAAMRRVAAQVEIARQTSGTVFLVGERGVGKEHIARLIHYGSPNRLQRFIPIRCAESSHREIERTLNRLYDPEGGQESATLYLDQIQELSLPLQQLVLKQLDLGRFRHFASSKLPIESFTDRDVLPELRWRFSALAISIPPLMQRGDDLLLLAQQILEEQNQTAEVQRQGFTPAVERLFLQYNWPGNLDEMSRIISRSTRQTSEQLIDVEHLPSEFLEVFSAQLNRPRPARRSLEEDLENFEKQRIEQALAESRGNKSVAAELLGMPRAKLYRRLAHFGLIQEGEEGKEKELPESDT